MQERECVCELREKEERNTARAQEVRLIRAKGSKKEKPREGNISHIKEQSRARGVEERKEKEG